MYRPKNLTPGASILDQLRQAGIPCTANDSIGHVLTDEQRRQIQADVQLAAEGLLTALVIDRDHNTADTAKRIAKMFVREIGRGRYEPEPDATDFPNARGAAVPYVVGPVTVRSSCSHHFAPILGEAWVAVDPGERVIGLSKFARLADWIMSRWQIQEEATVQLADVLFDKVKPKGLAVVVRSQHFCACWRGVKDDFRMTTTEARGTFGPDADMTPYHRAALDQINRGLE